MRQGRAVRKGRSLRPTRTDPLRDDLAFNKRRLQVLFHLPPQRVSVPPVSKMLVARYARMLTPIAVQAYAIVQRTVLPVLERLQAMADAARGDSRESKALERSKATLRESAARRKEQRAQERAAAQNKPHTPAEKEALHVPLELELALDKMDIQINLLIDGIAVDRIVLDIGPAVSTEQAASNAKQLQSMGLRVIEPKSELADMAAQWSKDNASLIRSVPKVVADRVRQHVETMVPQGARWETIAKKLRQEEGIAKDRAQFIARDQCSKYNGELTRARQQAAGISYFEWLGAMDDRERETHRILQATVWAWNNPPAIGYPGTPYRCRCRAVAAVSSEQIRNVKNWTPDEFATRANVSEKVVQSEIKAQREYQASRTNPATGAPYG